MSTSALNVTSGLMLEHQLILRFAKALDDYLDRYERDSAHESTLRALNSICEFIVEYSDHYHHAKEETILFEFMGRPGVLSHCNPLPQMLREHEEGRSATHALIQGLRDRQRETVLRSGREWSELIREHIYKEDNILYRFAEDGLTDDAKQDILASYQEVEKTKDRGQLQQKSETLIRDLELALR
jgi:hemerythrin-like domain-containing protein